MSIWDDDRIKLLKRMHGKGYSPREIAGTIGHGVSHRAVIGKAWRMGLAFSDGSRPPPFIRAPRRPRAAVQTAWKSQPVLPVDPVVIHEDIYVAPENRKGVLQLGNRDCKWPIGDPQHPDFHFCGGARVPGLPYCAHHAGKAYQSPAEIAAREARKRAA